MIIKIVGFLMTLLVPMTAFGERIEIPSSWKDSSSSPSSPGRVSRTNEVQMRETPTTGTVVQSCNKSTHRGTEVSLNFLDSITKEIIFDDEVGIDKDGNLEGSIYLNEYVSACFKPAISTVRGGGKIFVKIDNIYFDGANKDELERDKMEDIANKDVNIDKKYSECLDARGLIIHKNGKKTLDIEKIKNQGLVSSATLPYLDAARDGGNFPIKLNQNRTYQLYFASNKASDYGIPREDRVGKEAPGWDECVAYHQLSKEKPFVVGRLDRLKADVIDICSGSDVNEKLKDVLSLRNSPFLSSFGVLSGAVDDILISILEKEQEKIFKGKGENNLEDIEERMKSLMVESRRNAAKGIVDKDLGVDAKKLSQEYQKIIATLKSQVHEPAKKLIRKLHEDYENARERKDEELIEERLSKLTGIMGSFSEGKTDKSCKKMPCAFYRQFYVYEGKERFKKDNSKFEQLRLSSAYWSKSSVGGDRGSLSLSSVQRKINVGMRRHNRRMSSWRREASVVEGDMSPLRAQKKRIEKGMEKAQETYREGPYKGLSWWCRGANTKACLKKRRERERSFQRRMRRLGQSLERDQSRLMRYEGLAEQYRLRQEYEREQDGLGEEYDFFGDEYYYGDDYSFPGFGPGNQFQGPYDPSFYNMSPGGPSSYDHFSTPPRYAPPTMRPSWDGP